MATGTRTAPRQRRHWLAGDDAAAGIYGLILCASVMAAAAGTDTIGHVAVTVLVTLVVYWLAERYAELLADRSAEGPLSGRRIRRTLVRGWPMIQASDTPLLVLFVAWLFGADTAQAVLAALIVTTATLALLGWLAATRSGLNGWGRVAASSFAFALGLVVIALKLWLH